MSHEDAALVAKKVAEAITDKVVGEAVERTLDAVARGRKACCPHDYLRSVSVGGYGIRFKCLDCGAVVDLERGREAFR